MSNGICVVTGGSRGIGAAVAKRASASGWDILINYRANAEAAEKVAAAVRDNGRKAAIVRADIGTEAGIAATFEAADRMGRVTALVNNAGMGNAVGDVTTFSFEQIDCLVRLNLTGAIVCAREAIQRMAYRFGGEGGAIVNISSVSAKLGAPNQYVHYAATKGALETLTAGLALEWAREGIRVNAVRPGTIDTEFHHSIGTPNRVRDAGPTIPLGRAGAPEEIAEAVVWLMSDASSYSTGSVIDATGGRNVA
ncbi:SDR family oxidoreductase [Acuticoccus sp. M5D2P5]|uniref:SDR family oxidoreductase n=1 Tax=Acuticoccus kalidii TaxID=2910977 RepID=UPI001F2DD52D|nr:SDR family oxidoreductase [Acuticoccus kalidii]